MTTVADWSKMPQRATPSYTCGRCGASELICQDSPGQQLLQYNKWSEIHRKCLWGNVDPKAETVKEKSC